MGCELIHVFPEYLHHFIYMSHHADGLPFNRNTASTKCKVLLGLWLGL